MNDAPHDIPFIWVLGTHHHMIEIPEVVNLMASWIERRGPCRYVVNTGMHGLMEGCRNDKFKDILNSADPFTADGISVTWLARRHGFPLRRPPFRPLTPYEDAEAIRKINESKADIIWAGLGLPKQEWWIHNHRDQLNTAVAVGVELPSNF